MVCLAGSFTHVRCREACLSCPFPDKHGAATGPALARQTTVAPSLSTRPESPSVWGTAARKPPEARFETARATLEDYKLARETALQNRSVRQREAFCEVRCRCLSEKPPMRTTYVRACCVIVAGGRDWPS